MTEKAEQSKISPDSALDIKANELLALKSIQLAVYEKLADYQRLVQKLKHDEPIVTAAVESCQSKLQSAGNANERELQTLREEFARVENVLSQAVAILRTLNSDCAVLKAAGDAVTQTLQSMEDSLIAERSGN